MSQRGKDGIMFEHDFGIEIWTWHMSLFYPKKCGKIQESGPNCKQRLEHGCWTETVKGTGATA